jgi:hypothetical protein
MTHEEVEAELGRIRGLEEARQKKWHSIRRSATFCGGFFALAGFVLMTAALVAHLYSAAGLAQPLQILGVVAILASLPMTFIREALTDPVLPR